MYLFIIIIIIIALSQILSILQIISHLVRHKPTKWIGENQHYNNIYIYIYIYIYISSSSASINLESTELLDYLFLSHTHTLTHTLTHIYISSVCIVHLFWWVLNTAQWWYA